MNKSLPALASGAALVAALVAIPFPGPAVPAGPPMPYVGQAKVHAALDTIPLGRTGPHPATIPGGGGNVRNLGPAVLFVNNVRVLPGFTSYQSGVRDASLVQAPNQAGARDLKGWRMESGRWVYKGCRLGPAGAGGVWAIGNGDFAFEATSCQVG